MKPQDKRADTERSLSEESRTKRFEALQKEISTAAATLVSPAVTVTPMENGNKVTFTDRKGEHTFSVINGTDGTDGKHAYDYALDGGYTGTEADFIKKLAKELFTLRLMVLIILVLMQVLNMQNIP